MISRRTLLEGLGVSLVLPRPAHAIVGQGQRAAIVTSVAQPVIDVIAGQSNMIYGVPFTIANDKGSTEYLQMYSGNEGAANTISPGAQNDPLDNPDPTGQTTPAIGPAVHFYRDWYSPAFHPSKVLFLPCAYGGTPLINTGINTWGVTTATGGASVGSLTTNAIARIKLAKQLWPTAKLIFRFEDVEQDFNGYSTFQNTILSHFRGALHCWLLYMRSQMAAIGYANFPIIIGRPNPWALTIGGAGPNPNYWYPPNMVAADIIIRAVANRFPYVGIADSMNPTQATYQASPQSIHFDEAGQITMAGRYWIGYLQAIANTNFTTSPVWDPLDYLQTSLGYSSGFGVGSAGSSLSGDASSNWKSALATAPSLPSTSNKLYAEVKAAAVASSTNMMAGLANQSVDLLTYLGNATTNPVVADYGCASYWGGQTSLLSKGSSGTWAQTSFSCPNFVSGDVISLALDRSLGYAWIGRNGTWLGSGNPSAGSNPWITGIPNTDMVFIAASIYSGAGNTFIINGKISQFSYAPPSGFSAWGV